MAGKIRSFTHTEQPHITDVEWEITKQIRALETECNEIEKKQRNGIGFIPLIVFLLLLAIWNALNCFQILITNLSAWIEVSQPIVPDCGTIEAPKNGSTICNTFVQRMSEPITYFLTIQTNLSKIFRPRFECTQTKGICNDNFDDRDCNLWNAEELQIKPDPFRRDKDVCVNGIEIAFLVVTGILALSGLLLAYRWKRTVEVLGIEAEVHNLRRLSRRLNRSVKTPFPSIITQFIARKASQNSSVFTIRSNEAEEAPRDIKSFVVLIEPQEKTSEDSSVITIESNDEEFNSNQTIASDEAPMDSKSFVVLFGPQAEVSEDKSVDSSLFTIEQNKEKGQQSMDVPEPCELTILEVVNNNQSFDKATAEFVSFVPFSPSYGESNYIVAPQSKATDDILHDSSILTLGQNEVEEQLSQDFSGKHEYKITILEPVNEKHTPQEVRSFVFLPHSRNIS